MQDHAPPVPTADESHHLLLEVARDFLSRPADDIDGLISASLGRLGTSVGAARCFVTLFDATCQHLAVSHEWSAPGVSPIPAPLRRVPLAEIPSLTHSFQNSIPTLVDDVDALPPGTEAPPILAALGLRSVAAALMVDDGRWLGTVNFGFTGPNPDLEQSARLLLEPMCDIFRGALHRKRAEAEHERLQAELLEARRTESIVRLAGGVAHEFNNLLTVITGYSELLGESPTLDADQREMTQRILQATGRAGQLTSQLLAFGRKQVIRPRPVDLNAQVERAMALYCRILGEDIRIERRGRPDLPPILADPQQIDHLLGALLVNARAALSAAGVEGPERCVTIETDHAVLHGQLAETLHLPPGDYLVLAVSDTGAGLDDEARSRAFEPYYSAQGRGRGSGLGLATVQGIVQQNGGGVLAEGASGRGSTFRVFWPATQAPLQVEPVAPVATRPLAGTETILYAEDEHALRELTAKALRGLGYRVISAPDGAAAAALLDAMDPPPDLLLTDVVMPGLDGGELAARARARFPGLPVIFCSGYTQDIIARQGVVEPGTQLVEKPFTLAKLTARIRALLDHARSAAD